MLIKLIKTIRKLKKSKNQQTILSHKKNNKLKW